jgi:hypothetical protein
MPPSFPPDVFVKITRIDHQFPGQGGNGPLQTLFQVTPGASAFAFFIRDPLPNTGVSNSPAFIMNLGPQRNLTDGVIHDLPGQPIEPPHGKTIGGYNVTSAGIPLDSGDAITLQLANTGSLDVAITIYEFSPTQLNPDFAHYTSSLVPFTYSYQSVWGNNHAISLYQCPSPFALVYKNSITRPGDNEPAFLLALGTSLGAGGGYLHNTPGQNEINTFPQRGIAFDWAALLLAGQQIILQTGNQGQIAIDLSIIQFNTV